MYIEELKHFIKCIKNKEKTINNGYEAKKTLELALAAKRSAKQKKVITL